MWKKLGLALNRRRIVFWINININFEDFEFNINFENLSCLTYPNPWTTVKSTISKNEGIWFKQSLQNANGYDHEQNYFKKLDSHRFYWNHNAHRIIT